MKASVRLSVALAAGVLLTVAAGAPQAVAAQLRQVTEKVFPLEPGGEFRINSQNGRIVVEAWDRPEVRIQITREVRASDDERAAQLMKDLSADVTVSKTSISIESKYPKRSESVGIWDVLGQKVTALNIHYYVQVPAKTRVVLVTSNGEIRVRGIAGQVLGETMNGDVEVSSTTGHVEVSTTNGDIRLAGITGSARAGTTNGGINVEIRKLDVGDNVTLQTTNGNVSASLPSNLKATIEAVTTNGAVSIGYAIVRVGGSTSRAVVGTIGGGDGPAVKLRTTNGNVTVKKAGESTR
ncbi:MAG: DUF4097 family beta strand repeat-containing protein [Candidatus Eiseniibacteriota bacterium]